jgi:hypothetical protein
VTPPPGGDATGPRDGQAFRSVTIKCDDEVWRWSVTMKCDNEVWRWSVTMKCDDEVRRQSVTVGNCDEGLSM